MRRKADEPRVLPVVAGPGFARDGPSEHFGFRRRARVHHFFEQVGHHISVLRGNGITQIGLRLINGLVPEVLDREDEPRLADHAAVGEGGVGLRHVQRRNRDRTEADRQHFGEMRLQLQILGPLNDFLDPHLLHHADSAQVAGQGQRRAQQERPLKFFS